MFTRPSNWVRALTYLTLQFASISNSQSPNVDTTSSASSSSAIGALEATPLPTATSSVTAAINGTTEVFRPLFTVPPEADIGVPLVANILDEKAIDAQTVCPGYTGSNVRRTPYGLTATLTLAGNACNVYGIDVEVLNLTVEYQSADRLSIRIIPALLDETNSTQYLLPTDLVHQPTVDEDAQNTILDNDLSFVWSNRPSFSFSVIRSSTGDTLFSTAGSVIVFENQFIEFSSTLPENYNLYGLGETIHGFKLGNNFTKTMWAADVGDPID